MGFFRPLNVTHTRLLDSLLACLLALLETYLGGLDEARDLAVREAVALVGRKGKRGFIYLVSVCERGEGLGCMNE